MNGQRGKGRDAARRTPSRPAKPGVARGKKAGSASAARSAPEPVRPDQLPPRTFRLGAIAGATPGRWIDTWQERMPRHPLELVALSAAAQGAALRNGDVDAAIVRLPIDSDGLHVIPLYEEQPVVVSAHDSHLTAADELTAADLAGEVLITPLDDVLSFSAAEVLAPAFDRPATTEDAIAVVAAGVGIVVVPMSVARLHQRKDVASRPLTDGPVSPVGLAWDADRTDPLIDTFVGIVRGRSARSSRS